jgi:hypothetical protein
MEVRRMAALLLRGHQLGKSVALFAYHLLIL